MQIWFHATKCKFVAKNSSLKCWLCSHDFKNQKSQYMFFRAPNNIFAYTIVHLIFVAPQKVVCARVYAHVYLVMHLVQRQKYFRVEVNLRSIPLTINTESSLDIQTVFYMKRSNRQGLLSAQNQTTRQLSVNCV